MNSFLRRALAGAALLAIGFLFARLLTPHAEAQAIADKPIASGLVRVEEAVPTRGDWGEWRRYVRGATYGTRDMVLLAVTLKPGQAPHPPHRHAEEEVLRS